MRVVIKEAIKLVLSHGFRGVVLVFISLVTVSVISFNHFGPQTVLLVNFVVQVRVVSYAFYAFGYTRHSGIRELVIVNNVFHSALFPVARIIMILGKVSPFVYILAFHFKRIINFFKI